MPSVDDVLAAPHDDARRLVLADALVDAGDPRGDFIQRQAALSRLTGAALDRATAELARLQHQHGAAWVGALAPALELADCTFRLGFLDTAVITWRQTPADVRALVGRPEWRTVRRVAFNWPGPGLDPAKRRTPAAVTQVELLRKLPWVVGVSGVLAPAWHALETRRLEAAQVVLDEFPDDAFYRSLEASPKLTRVGLQSTKWAPPLQPAPVWNRLLERARQQLALEAIGEPGAWGRLARRLKTRSLAVRTFRTGNGWFIFDTADDGPALSVWLPDAGYFAEGTLRALEDLPLTDFVRVTVFTPGALLEDNERRLTQLLSRFGKAERQVLVGRLGVNPVVDERTVG